MRNTNCIICSNKFPPREGKLYCSNSCKQKGYSNKKDALTSEKEKKAVKEDNRVKYEFLFSDYQTYRKEYPTSLSSFIVFCFFRRNLKGEFNPKIFFDYLDSLDEQFWEDFWNYDESKARKRYLEFESVFFSEGVLIDISR